MTENVPERRSYSGSCLCEAVRFVIDGPLRDVIICHCGQCRRSHGHFAAYTAAPRDTITFASDTGLAWFRSSDKARRGFCKRCGSSPFWALDDDPVLRITAGSLESPTGLTSVQHIYVDDKSDYYAIGDDLPRESQSMLKRYPGLRPAERHPPYEHFL
ncbi:MAG: GFA family protein [Gammaproteobacteria bacterium]|nr:GFA family protein [Gammaproteobacteria bacterium]